MGLNNLTGYGKIEFILLIKGSQMKINLAIMPY
jgi:hypothetical protein